MCNAHLSNAGDEESEDEAEYAWLPYTNIKPFNLGDVSGNDNGVAPADPVLLASVIAAEAMLRSKQQSSSRSFSDDASDSDGGWGVSREQQPPPPPPAARNGRGRGRSNRPRGKRGHRGHGSRSARGRRGLTPEDDDASDSEGWAGEVPNSAAAAAVSGAAGGGKSAVEVILAWRMPLTQQQQEAEQVGLISV